MKHVLILLCAVALLASCGAGPAAPATDPVGQTAPTATPDVPDPTPDDTDYPALFERLFGDVPVNGESDFAFAVENGSATVTAYIGAGGAIRVPDTLGGATVTAVGDGAFAGRDDLETLILPDTVTDFGSGVLAGTALAALRTPFPLSVGYLGFLWGAAQYLENSQPALRSLKYLELRTHPDADAAFCLPPHALYECNDLVAVHLPNAAKVGEYAFCHCESLRYVNAGVIAEIGAHAFDSCFELRTLAFGEGLSRIGFAALRDCSSLTDLTLPFLGETREENTYLGYLFGAETVGFSSGFYSPVLRRVTLTSGCAVLPDFALYECRSLQAVFLPETLTAVGARALSGCTSLTSLAFPASCASIGDAACAGCISLRSVTYAPSAEIGVNAFLGCPLDSRTAG